MGELRQKIHEWFGEHQAAAPERKNELLWQIVELLIMQLTELKTVADGLDARLSQLEADVKAAQSAPALPAGLSAADQALVDSVGEVLTKAQARLDALHAALVVPPSVPQPS